MMISYQVAVQGSLRLRGSAPGGLVRFILC